MNKFSDSEKAALDRIQKAFPYHTQTISIMSAAIVQELRRMGHVRPFFMVYREGGRQPTFKHPDLVSASKEAARIRRESGEATYVLGVVDVHRAHAKPTIEEIVEHGRRNPYGDNRVGWGLWRIVRNKEMPHIVAVRSEHGSTPYISYDCKWHPGDHVANIPDDFDWFPLDANGKDVTPEDIPILIGGHHA